jgi:hypothetical protein
MSKAPILVSKINLNFMFFLEPLLDFFFLVFLQHGTQKRDFGTPSKSNGSPNGAQKLKIPYKKMKKRDAGRLLLAFPAQTDDAKAAQCAHGFHFHDIDVIFTDLPSILVPIFDLFLYFIDEL